MEERKDIYDQLEGENESFSISNPSPTLYAVPRFRRLSLAAFFTIKVQRRRKRPTSTKPGRVFP